MPEPHGVSHLQTENKVPPQRSEKAPVHMPVESKYATDTSMRVQNNLGGVITAARKNRFSGFVHEVSNT